MAFHKIDESAVVKDQSVDTALLQDLQDQAREAQQVRLPACAWVPDYRNPPRLVAYERHTLPFLLRLPPRASEVSVTVRAVADGALGVTLGLVVTALDWLERPLPADADTASVSSATEASVTLSAPTEGLTGWVIAHLTVKSAEGTPAEIAPSGGGSVAGHLEQTRKCDLLFAAASTQFGNEIPAAAVEIRSYDPASEASSAATWRPSNLSRRQVIRAAESTQSRLFFYPPAEDPQTAKNTTNAADVAWWVPLGWAKIFACDWSVSAADALPSARGSLNATSPPTAAQGQRLYLEGEGVWSEHGRWHHVGPQCDPSQTDLSDEAKGWWGASTSPPISPIHKLLQIAGTGWEQVGVAVVGRDGEYVDIDGTAKRRTGVTALALVCASSHDQRLTFDLSARLVAETVGTLAGDVTGGSTGQLVQTTPFVRRDPALNPVGWALAASELEETTGDAFTDDHVLHALRGLYDCARWGEYGWRIFEVEIRDDNLTVDGRLLRLQIDQVDEDADGEHPSASSPARYLHVATWTAAAMSGIDGSAIGEA